MFVNCSGTYCRSGLLIEVDQKALMPYLNKSEFVSLDIEAVYSFFIPYLDRALNRLLTPFKSKTPRTALYLNPGRSFVRPPRNNTVENFWRLCLIPGIKQKVFLFPLEKVTLATLRVAEFGFLGDINVTFMHVALRCGHLFNKYVLNFLFLLILHFLVISLMKVIINGVFYLFFN